LAFQNVIAWQLQTLYTNMKYRFPKLLFSIVGSVFVQCSANESSTFKLDLAAHTGKIYSYSFFHASSSSFLEQSRADTATLDIDIEVTAHQDFLNKLKITFRTVEKIQPKPVMEIKGKGFQNRKINELRLQLAVKTDSIMHALRGKQVYAIVNEKGIVEKVEGADGLVEQIASDLREDKRMVAQLIHDYASENAIADHLNLLFAAVAGKAVKPGDNWGKDVTLTTKAPININTLYTLKELKGDSAYLDVQSKVLGGTAGNFYLKGSQSGFTIVNYKSGLPYLIETRGNSTTTTNQYEVRQEDHWIIRLKGSNEKLLTLTHR
jgi:hypothetical protein